MKLVAPVIDSTGTPWVWFHGIPVFVGSCDYHVAVGVTAGTARGAVWRYLIARKWSIAGGQFELGRFYGPRRPIWYLADQDGYFVATWKIRPTRRSIARAIKALRRRTQASRRLAMAQRRYHKWVIAPDPTAPDTLGVRIWRWDPEGRILRSPFQQTPWPTSTLCAHTWSTEAAVEGEAGIHAYRFPNCWLAWEPGEDDDPAYFVVGVVERYGRAVVGPVGWRAECVVIRSLLAPSAQVAADLMERYPGIEIVVAQ